jgi:hypothetical protein
VSGSMLPGHPGGDSGTCLPEHEVKVVRPILNDNRRAAAVHVLEYSGWVPGVVKAIGPGKHTRKAA